MRFCTFVSSTGVARYIHFIPNARVPLLIFEGNYHNISFDVSIDNHLGIMKSKILLWISQMDERFRDMVLLVWLRFSWNNYFL